MALNRQETNRRYREKHKEEICSKRKMLGAKIRTKICSKLAYVKNRNKYLLNAQKHSPKNDRRKNYIQQLTHLNKSNNKYRQRWSIDELNYLENNYKKLTRHEIALNLRRTFRAVTGMLLKIKLKHPT